MAPLHALPCVAAQSPEARAYWPVLGLVLGPGAVLGVGLVVLGVSVPMPPAGEPEDVPDEAPLDESEGMPDELPPGDIPPVDASPERAPLLEEVPDAPSVGVEELPVELVPAPLVPEAPPVSEPEPSPVMPAHAPSSITQAIGNIHFIIDYSRKFQKAVRTAARTEGLHCECRE